MLTAEENKNVKRFIKRSLKNLNKYNGKIKFSGSSYYEFDTKTIHIQNITTMPFKDWLELFVHEYCHFLQQTKQSECYKKMIRENLSPVYVHTKLKNQKNLKSRFSFTRELEIECEKMTLDLIRKNKLPIDVKTFTKKANAYICYYHAVEKNKKWKNKLSIYNNRILKNMPSYLRKSYANKISNDSLKTILQCF